MSENLFRRADWADDRPQLSDDDDANGMPLRPHGIGLPDADLELLTLAARALGAERVEAVEGEQWVNLHFADRAPAFGWNPLRHGDDAFNLAVDLELDVMPSGAWVGEGNNELAAMVQNGCGIDEVEAHAGDARAATRRAITRVAAAIAVARAKKQA